MYHAESMVSRAAARGVRLIAILFKGKTQKQERAARLGIAISLGGRLSHRVCSYGLKGAEALDVVHGKRHGEGVVCLV